MNTTVASDRPVRAGAKTDRKKLATQRAPGGVTLGQESSREARRLAAAILEVLAGTRTPTQAATAIEVSLPRYYQLESRALRGLLVACEPRSKGRTRTPDHDLAALRRQHERLQQELTRHQALVRLAQRSIGLAPPSPPPAKGNGKKRQRRPVARALSVASRLQQSESARDVGAGNPQVPTATL